MALRNNLWVVTYGLLDDSQTVMYEADRVTVDIEGTLFVGDQAIFKKSWWLSCERLGKRIKMEDINGA